MVFKGERINMELKLKIGKKEEEQLFQKIEKMTVELIAGQFEKQSKLQEVIQRCVDKAIDKIDFHTYFEEQLKKLITEIAKSSKDSGYRYGSEYINYKDFLEDRIKQDVEKQVGEKISQIYDGLKEK